MKRVLFLVMMVLCCFGFRPAYSNPTLQLDFDSDNVYYDDNEENVTTHDKSLDLVALLIEDADSKIFTIDSTTETITSTKLF